MRELLDELGLRPLVVRIGLDFQVGVGGARLAVADRQKVALVRALLKRPTLLVLDQAAAALDPVAQRAWSRACSPSARARAWPGCCRAPSTPSGSAMVLVMERGKLVEKRRRVAELKRKTG